MKKIIVIIEYLDDKEFYEASNKIHQVFLSKELRNTHFTRITKNHTKGVCKHESSCKICFPRPCIPDEVAEEK